MGKRTSTAVWMEKQKRWQIKVQKDGVRRTFYSFAPGRTGQREANAKADAWLDDGISNTGTKVSKLYAAWLEELACTVGTSYLNECTKYGEYYILPVCGNISIGDLNEGHLQTVLNKSFKHGCLKTDRQRKPLGRPLSKKTLQGIRSTERAFVKWCRLHKYTTLYPENLTVPKAARCVEKNILQPQALSILFSTDTRSWHKQIIFDDFIYAYRFEVATGLRPGELVGICYGDVKGRTVTLRRSINIYSEETQGKNENALRTFDLNDVAYEAYTAQVQLLKDRDIQLNYSTPLFPVGSERAFYRRWQSYQESNGITPKISLYELRHTFVSISAGTMNDGQLRLLVGHSRNMDTLGVYNHEIEGRRQRLAVASTEAFNKALP
jgi:integrase